LNKGLSGVEYKSLRVAQEVVLLIMVSAGPWLYGAVHPGFELLLDLGLLLLLGLWALRMLLERRVTLVRCPVTLLLGVLLLLGLWQLTPLPAELLRTIAPATAHLYEGLLPERQESPPPAGPLPPIPAAGATLSLYPEGTRGECYRLLAVLLLFAVVGNNLGTPQVLQRLAVVTVVNGTALCMFAVVQFFTSRPDMLYWTYPAQARVFGPFVSKNLFPFYVNVCLCLGIGLLLARWRSAPPDAAQGSYPGYRRRASALREVLTRLLQDAPSLWLLVAIAFMASTVALSLSRGGFVALVCAVGLAVVLVRTPSRAWMRLAAVTAVGGLALFFLSWIGMSAVQQRLHTLWTPEKADQTRVPLWLRVLPLAGEFPLWGTGLGSFRYVELWRRGPTPLDPDAAQNDTLAVESLQIDHAHNDFIEILVEAGFPGLLVMLTVLVLVYRYGLRAVFRAPSRQTASLALGGICGLTAVVVHSLVDFGMRAPAIALLTVVLCALLSAVGSVGVPALAGSSAPKAGTPTPAAGTWELRLAGVAPIIGATLVVVLGLLLCTRLWREHRVERLQAAAARIPADAADRRQLQLPYLEAAARLAPNDPMVRMEVAHAHTELLEAQLAPLDQRVRFGAPVDNVLLGPALPLALPGGFAVVVVGPAWNLHWFGRGALEMRAREEAVNKHVPPALHHYVAARNACPLVPEAQLALGVNADRLPGAQPREVYFQRAQFLSPRMPEVWYYSGLDHLTRNQPEQAWQDWRQCLALSDRYLDAILFRSVRLLNARQLLAKVLPAQPHRIVQAGDRLFSRPDKQSAHADFLRNALASFDPREQSLSVNELRYELARLLVLRNDDQQAMQQLLLVLESQPDHKKARALYRDLERKLGK
jgi:O-antigen ligase